ncbi:MAG: hypothetical protein VB858_21140, partial [Planctomycetaceae bacterium]
KRPTLTLTEPRVGSSTHVTRILLGMADYYSGIEIESLSVVADFPVNGSAAGDNLAGQFRSVETGVLELNLEQPLVTAGEHTVSVSVKDRQGNVTAIKRTFRIKAIE